MNVLFETGINDLAVPLNCGSRVVDLTAESFKIGRLIGSAVRGSHTRHGVIGSSVNVERRLPVIYVFGTDRYSVYIERYRKRP